MTPRAQQQFFSNRDILDQIVLMNFADREKLSEFYRIHYNVFELLDVLINRGFLNEEQILAMAHEMVWGQLDIVTEVNGIDYKKNDIYLKGIAKEVFYEMVSEKYRLDKIYTMVYNIDHLHKRIYIVAPLYPIAEIANKLREFKVESKILNKKHTVTFEDENGNQKTEERELFDYDFIVQIAPISLMRNILASNEQVDRALNEKNKAMRERAIRSGFGDLFQENTYTEISGTLSEIGDIPEWQVIKLIQTGKNGFNDVIASDIHIEPKLSSEWGFIRYRVNGWLTPPKDLDNVSDVLNQVKRWAGIPVEISGTKQDGAINIKFGGERYSYRVSFMPIGEKDKKKQKLVMRELTDDISRLDLKKNKMDERFVSILENLLGAPKEGKVGKYKDGLFLMTGPTGSGKSTTIMSILNSLNTTDVNIITLEDPIEYKVPGINQSQIFHPDGRLLEGEDPANLYSFQQGIEASLRQDPDIIFVGEIRNPTTMNATKVAAMTWHAVLSTLHTNNTFETLERIVWLGIDVDTISSFVRLIMAQRLASQVCPYCRKEYNDPIFSETQEEQTKRNLEYLKRKMEVYTALADSEYVIDLPNKISDFKLYKGVGCSRCNYTGLGKRVGIYEFLEVDIKLQNFLTNSEIGGIKATKETIREYYTENDIITLYQNAMYKVATGVVYPEIKDANGNPTKMYMDFDSAVSAAGGDIYGYAEKYKGLSLLEIEDIIMLRKKERELHKYEKDFTDLKDEAEGLMKFVGLDANDPYIKEISVKIESLKKVILPLRAFIAYHTEQQKVKRYQELGREILLAQSQGEDLQTLEMQVKIKQFNILKNTLLSKYKLLWKELQALQAKNEIDTESAKQKVREFNTLKKLFQH